MPLIASPDFRILKTNLPILCCNACYSKSRVHFTNLIVCQTLGLDLRLASKSEASTRTPTAIWNERAARDGLFDRLAERGVLGVHWQAIKRGAFSRSGFYWHTRPIDRVVGKFGTSIEEEQVQRRRELAKAAGGAGDGFGFRANRSGDVTGISDAARRLIRARSKHGLGGGADARSGLGDDRYADSLNILSADIAEECLKLARRDQDDQMRLDALLYDNAIRGSKLVAVPAGWLRQGARWKTHGLVSQIVDGVLDIAGDQFQVDQLDRIPVDRDTLKLVKTLPRMSEPAPF